jgi:hypothetical protein|uniref:DUF4926 domain-containing protein n=1 Tax=Ignavibacterium album TaxID=591197 RepID=A0A832G7G0_9BACT
MKEIKLFDLVSLKENVANPPLFKGMIGTVIHIYKPNRLYEVEFITKEGESFISVVLENFQLVSLEEFDMKSINEITFFGVKI